ncbi:MAG: glycosyltransferase family 9 protein [Candidatus Omnitrophica bacterium]|nr:glycosyltransferase family 9 protein [Candidatus Omnitrophota bacterium]
MQNKKILIVNPFGIGDVLFTVPMIEAIKTSLRGSYLGYLCNIRSAPILLNHPRIDKVFIFEKDEYRQLWQSSRLKCIKRVVEFLKEIKSERFDTVFDLSLAREYGLFLKLAGIRERIGYDYRRRGIFLTKKTKLTSGYSEKHMIDYYLELLKFTNVEKPKEPVLNLAISQESKKDAKDILESNDISSNETFITLAPGGGASWGGTSFRKQWPKEKFAELTTLLCNRGAEKVLLLGGYDDSPICDYIKKRESRCINLCGKTDLLTFIAIVGDSRLLVTNDGGPLHIGVAAGIKTVSIFGPVDERVYGPYRSGDEHSVVVNNDIDCRPCYKRFKIKDCQHRNCLEDISVEEVAKEAKSQLKSLERINK